MDDSSEILGYAGIRDKVLPITRESDEKDARLARKIVACRKCGLAVEPINISEGKFAEILDEHRDRCEGPLEHFYRED